jgi:hypothetical protein
MKGIVRISAIGLISFILFILPVGILYRSQTPVDAAANTIGYSTVGKRTDSNDSNCINASRFTMGGSGGSIASVSVRVGKIASSPSNQFQVAVYSDNNGTPGNLITSSASKALTANTWNTVSLATYLSANTAYWLAYNTNGNNGSVNDLLCDNTSTYQSAYTSASFGKWPSSMGSITKQWIVFSIYATIQTGATPAPTPSLTSIPTLAPTATATPSPVPSPTQTITPAPTITTSPTPTPTPGSDTLVLDSFTAANSTSLDRRIPDIGNPWSVQAGSWTVVNNAAQNGTSPDYCVINVGRGAVRVEADITTPITAPSWPKDWFVGLMAAANISNGQISDGIQARLLYQNNSSEIELWEFYGGRTSLGDSRLNMTKVNLSFPGPTGPIEALRPNTTYHLALEVFGQKAVAYLDGVPRLEMKLGLPLGTGANQHASTSIAITVDSEGSSGSRIDNLRVTALSSLSPITTNVCGDGVCQGNECCSNCDDDCGACR